MLLAVLEWLALRRKRPGAHGIWTAAAFAAFLLRMHHRQRARESAVALREELRPGESLLITHTNIRRG
jgi:hypothetical protein